MTPGLGGRHALVTGGAGGIGAAAAIVLAGHGANVTLLGRDQTRLNRTTATIGGAVAVVADVRDPISVASAFAARTSRRSLRARRRRVSNFAKSNRTKDSRARWRSD